MSEKFLNNRLKFHSASRVGIQEGESLLAAANKDQHTVDISSVWSSPIADFPLNNTTYKETTNTSAATEDLINVFTNNRTEGGSVEKTSFNGGVKWTNSNYPAVTLYENVLMTPVANSNGSGSLYESYEILTLVGGEKVRLQDWVSPVAMFDPNIKKPIPGYTGKVEVYETGTNSWVEIQETAKSVVTTSRGSEWAANYGNWEFIYYAGIVTFNADYTPSRSSWIANFGKYSSSDLTNIPTSISDTSDIINKVVKLRWTGFLYTGDYASDKQVIDHADLTTGTVSTYPVNDTDISNKKYVDDKSAALADDLSTHNLSVDAHPNGFNHTIDMHSNDVTNVKSLDADTITSTSLTVNTVAVTDSVDIANELTVDEVNVGDKLALHDKQIKNMFAGATLPDTTNIDEYSVTGITRITSSIDGVKPPIDNCSGFLQVMDVDHDDDTTDDKTKRKIRQIIYPDSKDDSTPYSRVGIADSLSGDISWSEWTQMGGGSLRRVVINGTTTPVTVVAVNNVMYESFGANTFTMPDPDTVPVGTRIGFEQFIGTARVSSSDDGTSFVQILEPDVPDSEYDSQPGSTAVSYVFECVLGQNGTKREWMLDVDHNYAAAITSIVSRTEALSSRLTTAESDIDTLEGRATRLESRAGSLESRAESLETRVGALEKKDKTHDDQISTLQTRATNLEDRATRLQNRADALETMASKHIHGEFAQRIARTRLTKHVKWGVDISAFSTTAPTTDQVNHAEPLWNFLKDNSYTLYYYDLIVSVMNANNQTITLPTSGAPVGTKVTFELYPAYTVTITDTVNTETFSGDKHNILVLEFEYTYTTDSTTAWTLLSLEPPSSDA